MGSTIKIKDSNLIKSYGQTLSALACTCTFLDPTVENTYAQAKDNLSQTVYHLRKKLQQAKDNIAHTEDKEAREALRTEVETLSQRVNQAEQLLNELKKSLNAYKSEVRNMQAEFSERADKVGSVLVSYIEALEESR